MRRQSRRRQGRGLAAAQALLLLLSVVGPLVQARPVDANPGDITAYAGGGLGAGPPLKVGQDPWGITVFGSKTYVSDDHFNVVRVFDSATGLETVAAGTGAYGLSGDGQAATQAQLSTPEGLAVDGAGDLFIADTGNSRIREVTTDGIIHTYAGSTRGNACSGTATTAQFANPDTVFVDGAGNLFVGDAYDYRVCEVKADKSVVQIAGKAMPGSYPCDPTTLCDVTGVVLDSSGAIFIADHGNGLLRKSDTSGNLTTVLTDPLVTALALDGGGNLFVANAGTGPQAPALVKRIGGPSASGAVTTYAGGGQQYPGAPNGDGGPATSAILQAPVGLAVDTAGNLLIADWADQRVRKVDTSAQHIISTAMGTGDSCGDADDGSPATSAQLCPTSGPGGLAFDGQANLLIGDSRGHAVRRVNAADGTIGTVVAGLSGITGMAPDGSGGVYAIEYNVLSVIVTVHHVDSQGVDHTPIVNGPGAPLVAATGAASDASGNLYVGSRRQITKVSPTGYATIVAGVYDAPYGVVCSGDGGPASQAAFFAPQVVGFDSAGDLFVYDAGAGHSVREIDTSGNVRSVISDGTVSCGVNTSPVTTFPQLRRPAVAINQYGDLYVLDYCTVSRVTAGVVATVVNTTACSSPSGGPGPFWSIAVAGTGALYLSDTTRVWRVEPYPPPSAPLSVSATGGIGQATVSWQPPASNGGSPIGGYVVTPIQDGTPLAPLAFNSAGTSATVSNLRHHSYTFTVRAVNAGGGGPPSQPSSPVTVQWVPGTPLTVTARAGDAQATISWSPPQDDGGLPITGYRVTALGGPPDVVQAVGATSTVLYGLVNFSLYTFTVEAENAAGTGPPASSNQVMPQLTVIGGNYRPLTPARILDTRLTRNPLGPGATLQLAVLGRGGIPASGVSAVIVNVTAVDGTANSFLRVYPTLGVGSSTSSLNWRAGQTVPNLVVVRVGRAGNITLFNAAGSVDVVIDVEGYIGTPVNSTSDDGLFATSGPQRLLDTRTSGQSLGPHGVLTVAIPPRLIGMGGVTTIGAVLNVTVTNPTAGSYLTVWPDGQPMPGTSNLNFVAGQTVPNRVIVPVGANGLVDISNAAGQVDVIVDLNGWFMHGSGAGTRYTAILPHRLFDSRTNGPPLTPDLVLTLQVPSPATAIALNVTVTNPSAPSFLAVFPDPGPGMTTTILTSDLNYGAGQTVANLVVVGTGYNGTIDFYNVAGSADVIIDVVGYFGPVYTGVPSTPAAPTYRARPGRR